MGRKPDYILKLRHQETKDQLIRAGVAWVNEKGWIDINLDPGVVLHWNDPIHIDLYPNEESEKK